MWCAFVVFLLRAPLLGRLKGQPKRNRRETAHFKGSDSHFGTEHVDGFPTLNPFFVYVFKDHILQQNGFSFGVKGEI